MFNINKNLKELERTISAFAVGRLLIVVVAIATMYYLYKADKFIYLCASFSLKYFLEKILICLKRLNLAIKYGLIIEYHWGLNKWLSTKFFNLDFILNIKQ